MKNFRVIESSDVSLVNKKFAIQTEISKYVKLPFTEEKYRVNMFDGLRVKLIKEKDYIIGTLF